MTTNNGDTGYIGSDKSYQFSEHLKDRKQHQIIPGAEDFYVPIKIFKIEYKDPLIVRIIEFVLKKIFFFLQPDGSKEVDIVNLTTLPSNLFYGAKEGERIRFYYDDRPIDLSLKQNANPDMYDNFDDSFNQLQQNVKNEGYFWSEIDIPNGMLVYGKKKLSADARFYTKEKGCIPLTEEDLLQFNAFKPTVLLSYSEYENGKIEFDAPGLKEGDFKILIDRRLIIIIAHNDRGKFFFKMTVKDNSFNTFDLDKVSIQRTGRGTAIFTYGFIEKSRAFHA
jgi:hypothetical protein